MTTIFDQVTVPPVAPRRRRHLVGVAVVAIALVLVLVSLKLYQHHQREQEWEHGGDAVRIGATVVTVSGDQEFKAALKRAGGDPWDFHSGAKQGFVVTVTWEGPAQPSDGHFQFVLLDARLHTPQPIPSTGGSNWSGAYGVLAEHYPWLAATARQRFEDGGYGEEMSALDADASRSGRTVLAFALGRDERPVADGSTELILAMFLVEADQDYGDQVRWAKQVPLTLAG